MEIKRTYNIEGETVQCVHNDGTESQYCSESSCKFEQE